MMKCLYCYLPTANGGDFHQRCSKKFFGSNTPPKIEYSLSEISELAREVIERSVSVPGVQPKLSMSIIQEAKTKTDHRLTVIGALGGKYIFKPPNADYQSLPENEHVTMRLAEAMRITVVPSTLIRMKSGELAYLTKRIDRTANGEKIHMLDMFQIHEAFDKYRGSHERISKALSDYSAQPLLDKMKLFELILFCYLIGNNDMHLKNFSMINQKNEWKLAPAYDLLNVKLAIPEDSDELALTLDGKKSNFSKDHFLNFAISYLALNTKQINGAFNRLKKLSKAAPEILEQSPLEKDLCIQYNQLINERLQQIGLN